jgi:phage gpG-like protein
MTDQANQVRILGAERLDATLHVAAAAIADHRALNARTATAIARGMRERAPRRTGRLVASIRPASDGDSTSAGTPLLYGAVQEYGSPPKHIRAQPYGRPTLADLAPDYQGDLTREIQDDLDRVEGA